MGGPVIRQSKETVWFRNLPGLATFFFKGDKLDLPPGFHTAWKTRPMAP
jgi:hypothetical protein